MAAVAAFSITSSALANVSEWADPIKGAFGIELGGKIGTAIAAGFKKEEYEDGGVFYRLADPSDFFQTKIVRATPLSGAITSIEANRVYRGMDADQCRNDLKNITYEIQNKYPSLESSRDAPLTGIAVDVFVRLRAKDPGSDQYGRSVEIICGELRDKIVLSVAYKGSPAEFKRSYWELVEQRNARKIEESGKAREALKERGIDPDQF